ncbi:CRISPR-associated helicase, Cas3 family [Kytococcus aerolatus]|uniref:CRISPR-associated helicase, Cas3 family n=1 Tax=Kytococcus aerolatus TaxID=592308 RepID=A0A212U5F7_9MICO|nr:CRISPR-associated helicase Cas3' [Kytococcus aerolatus]SNC73495.1 CRISPR-associated helicase, Cas3 family [Kytococcus aerolatus]
MSDVTPATESLWAKSPNEAHEFLPLHRHLEDAAEVAGWLWDSWLPAGVAQRVATAVGLPVEDLRRVAVFLAGVHDIGKATPAFASMHDHLYSLMQAQGLVGGGGFSRGLRRRAHHTRTGAWILTQWLESECGVTRATALTYAAVVGGHHGAPPTSSELIDVEPTAHPSLYGHGQWDVSRSELLERAWSRAGMARLGSLPALPQTAQAALTGLVIVADWIASNEALFPYAAPLSTRVEDGLTELGLPSPWKPAEVLDRDAQSLVASRFDLPPGATVRPVQEAAVGVARESRAPGLMVIEAPMGEGKTEAALAAAEVLAARHGLGGVFVALPTQATTDAMFSRVVSWVEHLPGEEMKVGASITLAHGKARMNRLYQGLRPHPGEVDTESSREGGTRVDRVVVHEWLSGRKKGTLANVVVGTVDQVLFAALRSKHLALRMLGLYGKVVVIDEVHAYDAWMNVYLTRVLSWLGAAGVPTILLSATLPPARRQELISAYAPESDSVEETTAYPVVTWVSGESASVTEVPPSGRGHWMAVEMLPGDLQVMAARARELYDEGGCVLVVVNTVGRAQRLFREVAATLGEQEVTLTHSRFVAADRARRDVELVERFGPPRDGVERPARHVVVGTQVVEQSLDVDFDAMISDLAPMDLLLQRAGRMHRHDRSRPAARRVPTLWVGGHAVAEGVPDFGASSYVYAESLLLATLGELQSRGDSGIELPGDIPGLVASTYSTAPQVPIGWQELWQEAEQRDAAERRRQQKGAQAFALKKPGRGPIQGWAAGEVGDPEQSDTARAAVRDIEETLEVMLVAVVNGEWRILPWLTEEPVTVPREVVPDESTTALLNDCTVRLPPGSAWNNAEVEQALWDETPEAWEFALGLSGVPVLALEESPHYYLVRMMGVCHDRAINITYTPQEGLTMERVSHDQ